MPLNSFGRARAFVLGAVVGVLFKAEKGAAVTITVVVQANDGGAVKATYVWENVSDPLNPSQIHIDPVPVWSSEVSVTAAALGNATANIYSMLVRLLTTADAQVWAWARQNGVFLPAFNSGGNPITPEGPHGAVRIGTATKAVTSRQAVAVRAS